MNHKGFIKIAVILGVIILMGIAGYIITNRQATSPEPALAPTPSQDEIVARSPESTTLPTPLPSPTPAPSPSPTPSPTPKPSPSPTVPSTNGCQKIVSYSAEAYLEGWKRAFKKENNLSDSEFSTHITVNAVSMHPSGLTCELSIRYTVKKDWLLVNREDHMTLGVPPSVSPDNLPLESDPSKPGAIGVSTVNLHDTLSFKSQNAALDFFVDKYNLKDAGARTEQQGFQYFWYKEEAEKSGTPFAGEGGEAYVSVWGTINQTRNECFSGRLSLVTKETTYTATPCWISAN